MRFETFDYELLHYYCYILSPFYKISMLGCSFRLSNVLFGLLFVIDLQSHIYFLGDNTFGGLLSF